MTAIPVPGARAVRRVARATVLLASHPQASAPSGP